MVLTVPGSESATSPCIASRHTSNGRLVSALLRGCSLAAVRVRPAHRDYKRPIPRPEEWLLTEWPENEPESAKYRLSTLPPTATRRAMVEPVLLAGRARS